MKKILLTLASLSLVFGADALAATATSAPFAIRIGTKTITISDTSLLPKPIPNPVPLIKPYNSNLPTVSCGGDTLRRDTARYIVDTRAANITKIIDGGDIAKLSSDQINAIRQENVNFNKLKAIQAPYVACAKKIADIVDLNNASLDLVNINL